MNGHITSFELKILWKWINAPKKRRKEAVLSFTSGLARQIAYLIEKNYIQKKDFDKIKKYRYEDVFTSKPFMCENCYKP